MIVSPDALRKETVALIKQIDEQIKEIELFAYARDIASTQVTDGRGNWVMTPLLQAKATAYNTLVLLQTKK